jgi:hypothetical protein
LEVCSLPLPFVVSFSNIVACLLSIGFVWWLYTSLTTRVANVEAFSEADTALSTRKINTPLQCLKWIVASSDSEEVTLERTTSSCNCCAPLQKGCSKHHGHKGDPGVTPGTCGAGSEKAQMILVWVRPPGVGNASHPRSLGVMRVKP